MTEATHSEFKSLSQEDRTKLAHLIRQVRMTRDVHHEFEGQLTLGQRLADKVATLGGSWSFIIIFAAVILGWIVLNSIALGVLALDRFPYTFLNLILSMIAALQAPIIMMSQSRQSAKDRMVQQHDYEVDLKVEFEIMALHEKLDALRHKQFVELMEIQNKQIEMLTVLASTKL